MRAARRETQPEPQKGERRPRQRPESPPGSLASSAGRGDGPGHQDPEQLHGRVGVHVTEPLPGAFRSLPMPNSTHGLPLTGPVPQSRLHGKNAKTKHFL